MTILRELHFDFDIHPESGEKWESGERKFPLDQLKNLFAICHFDKHVDIGVVADDKLGWSTFDECMDNCDHIDSLRGWDRDESNNYERRSGLPLANYIECSLPR